MLALTLAACSSATKESANANSAATTQPVDSGPKRFDVVFALHGTRQPSDTQIAGQKREYINILIPNTLKQGEYDTVNLDRKFGNMTDIKLTGDERVYVVTIAAPAGKKIEKGNYQAYGDERALDSIPPGEGFAVISRYDAAGVKRTAGTVNVNLVDKKMIGFNFRNLADTLGLKDISYGAPYKN